MLAHHGGALVMARALPNCRRTLEATKALVNAEDPEHRNQLQGPGVDAGATPHPEQTSLMTNISAQSVTTGLF
jgi:hypothetical protein